MAYCMKCFKFTEKTKYLLSNSKYEFIPFCSGPYRSKVYGHYCRSCTILNGLVVISLNDDAHYISYTIE